VQKKSADVANRSRQLYSVLQGEVRHKQENYKYKKLRVDFIPLLAQLDDKPCHQAGRVLRKSADKAN